MRKLSMIGLGIFILSSFLSRSNAAEDSSTAKPKEINYIERVEIKTHRVHKSDTSKKKVSKKSKKIKKKLKKANQ